MISEKQELIAKHEVELNATIQLVKQTTSSHLEEQIAALQQKLLKASTSEVDMRAQVTTLKETVQQLQDAQTNLIKR